MRKLIITIPVMAILAVLFLSTPVSADSNSVAVTITAPKAGETADFNPSIPGIDSDSSEFKWFSRVIDENDQRYGITGYHYSGDEKPLVFDYEHEYGFELSIYKNGETGVYDRINSVTVNGKAVEFRKGDFEGNSYIVINYSFD